MKDKEKNIKNKHLVYIPDGAKIKFDNFGKNPPKTKYNAWKFNMDEKTYNSIIGRFYGPFRNKYNS